MSNTKKETVDIKLVINPVAMPLHENLQDLVNLQIDINRAVWAGNLSTITNAGSFNSKKERDDYIQNCLLSAYKTLQKLVSEK